MVNASLNWASIVGIVLAVCGGGLYFLRSFKPALARDYDVFFAAIGLLCGGILFFQGWRLDPILQFGQFLLAGTTVFFAYESVRLRGIATDQARRSSFFEDEQMPAPSRGNPRRRWDDEYDQFEPNERVSRRFQSRDDDNDLFEDDDRFLSRRSRAIPESAASRRRSSSRDLNSYKEESLNRRDPRKESNDINSTRNNFGERRTARSDMKRGSRPVSNPSNSRQTMVNREEKVNIKPEVTQRNRTSVRAQTSKKQVEEASFTQKNTEQKKPRQVRRSSINTNSARKNQPGRYNVGSKQTKPRDNSSRFDD